MERKWRVLIVVCVAVFMLLLDITVVNVALPNIDNELHTSFTELQWVIDAYALTLAATMLNAGSLGDLLGRKRVFLVAIVLFTIASTLCGAAQSPLWLILARGGQGIGGAGMYARAARDAGRGERWLRPAGVRDADGRAVRTRARPAARQRLGLVDRADPRPLRRSGCAAGRIRRRRVAAAGADVRHPALPRAHVHRSADHGLLDLLRDVRSVPLPGALPRERAGPFCCLGGRTLPAAVARLVRRRADLRTPLGTSARAFLLSGGLALCGIGLLLMHGLTIDSGWTALLAGFIVAGVGIRLVNAPLASTSVSVVEPRRAGMASGINNTFRQVGIATGIAALGAIFQSKIASHLAGAGVPASQVHSLAQETASGGFNGRIAGTELRVLQTAFIGGLNEILLVASFVLFAGAVLAFVLVRQRDFVASAPAVAAEAG